MIIFLRIADAGHMEEGVHRELLTRCIESQERIREEMVRHGVVEAFIDAYGSGHTPEPLISCAIRFADPGKDLGSFSAFAWAVSKIIDSDIHPLSLGKLNEEKRSHCHVPTRG